MKKAIVIILLSVAYFFVSCGNDPKKYNLKKLVDPVHKLKSVSQKNIKKIS